MSESSDGPLFTIVSQGEPCIVYDAGSNRLLNLDAATVAALPLWNSNTDNLPETAEFNVLRSAEKNHGWMKRERTAALIPAWDNETVRKKLSGSLDCLVLAVTTSCNFRCSYCLYGKQYEGYRSHGNSRMDLSTAEKAISFCARHSQDSEALHLNFYGGEPLLNFPVIEKSILRFPEIAQDRLYYYHLTSNGLLLNDQRIAELLIRHNVFLTISLDGPAEYHDSRRRTRDNEATFKTIMEGVELLDRLDHDYFLHRVSFNTVIDGIEDLPATRSFFLEHPLLKNQNITCSTVKHDGINEPPTPASKKILSALENELFDQFRNEKPHFDIFLKRILLKDIVKIHQRPAYHGFAEQESLTGLCIPGRKELFVDHTGSFHICENTCDELTIGNLDDGYDFDAIDRVIETFTEISNELCRHCWAIRFCSLCFIHAFTGKNADKEKLSRYCDRERDKILRSLQLYVRLRKEIPSSSEVLDDNPFG